MLSQEQMIIAQLADMWQEDLINEYMILRKKYNDLKENKEVANKKVATTAKKKCEHNFVYVGKDRSDRPIATYKKYMCTKCWKHHYEDDSWW